MKRVLILFYSLFLIAHFVLSGVEGFPQNVGIGTTNPLARLHVADSSVVFTADGLVPPIPGDPPVSGDGRRMMWYADKAAFRSGYVGGSEWNMANIGAYSFATGFEATAHGDYSAAMGYSTYAFGLYSTAMGYNTTAGGMSSTAMGSSTYATGLYSTAMGNNTFATGQSATAMGSNLRASGHSSVAMGDNTLATGDYSTAIGSYVNTSGLSGCLTIGDRSTTAVMETFVANGFRARFAGGYRLFTSSAVTIGAFLNANANSWGVLSDVRLKENFLPVNGEVILQKIADMPQYTWNYKGQDVKTLRHYGPMAQDFYKAFGRDEFGEIGCDTLINQQDFLGVSFIALQALEKRTQEIKALKEMISLMRKEIDELRKEKK